MSARVCEVCAGSRFTGLFRKDDHAIHRCEDCGLERIDPQPSDETLRRTYGAHYYRAWGANEDLELSRQMKTATFAQYLRALRHLPRGSRVVDCGAAFGFLMEVASEAGFTPYGIEYAADAAAHIIRRFGPDRVFAGAFEAAGFSGLGEGAFHAAFMCDFIEHVRDPEAVLKKANRLLARGGILVISTPDTRSVSRRLLGPAWPHFKVEHLYYFNRRNLARLLDRCGFGVIHAQGAWKRMNLEYVRHQFNVYRHRVFTPAVNRLVAALPGPLRRQHFPIAFGECLLYARRN